MDFEVLSQRLEAVSSSLIDMEDTDISPIGEALHEIAQDILDWEGKRQSFGITADVLRIATSGPLDEVAVALHDLEKLAQEGVEDSAHWFELVGAFAGSVRSALQSIERSMSSEGVAAAETGRLFRPIRTRTRQLTALASQLNELATGSERVAIARESLSEVGAKRLALGFDEQYRHDNRLGNIFRSLAIIGLSATVGFAYANVSKSSGWTTSAAVTHMAAIIPALALCEYIAREASSHLRNARLWRVIQLQLASVDLYTTRLTPDEARDIQIHLGRAVFSGPLGYADLIRERGIRQPRTESADPRGGSPSADEFLSMIQRLLQSKKPPPGSELDG